MYLLQHLFPYALGRDVIWNQVKVGTGDEQQTRFPCAFRRDVIQDKRAVIMLDGDGAMWFLYTLGCDISSYLRIYASAQILNGSPYTFGRNVIRNRDAYFMVRALNSVFPYALWM
ncbi:hypothetical protein AB0B27_11180 [Micromonospora rifamycinica]|uniref:hypothetical protein n=1 Tax=Micromonospora rifamycinica TaxID=291594 RepID=UPI0033E65194